MRRGDLEAHGYGYFAQGACISPRIRTWRFSLACNVQRDGCPISMFLRVSGESGMVAGHSYLKGITIGEQGRGVR